MSWCLSEWRLSRTSEWRLSRKREWRVSRTSEWRLSRTSEWRLSRKREWRLSRRSEWPLSRIGLWGGSLRTDNVRGAGEGWSSARWQRRGNTGQLTWWQRPRRSHLGKRLIKNNGNKVCFLYHQEIQNRTTMWHHCTPNKNGKKKGQKTANVGEEMEPSHVAGGSANGTTTLENYFQYLLKKSGHPLYWPSNSSRHTPIRNMYIRSQYIQEGSQQHYF